MTHLCILSLSFDDFLPCILSLVSQHGSLPHFARIVSFFLSTFSVLILFFAVQSEDKGGGRVKDIRQAGNECVKEAKVLSRAAWNSDWEESYKTYTMFM